VRGATLYCDSIRAERGIALLQCLGEKPLNRKDYLIIMAKANKKTLLAAVLTSATTAHTSVVKSDNDTGKMHEVIWSAVTGVLGKAKATSKNYQDNIGGFKAKLDKLVVEIEKQITEGGYSPSHAKNELGKALKKNGLNRRKVADKAPPVITGETETDEDAGETAKAPGVVTPEQKLANMAVSLMNSDYRAASGLANRAYKMLKEIADKMDAKAQGADSVGPTDEELAELEELQQEAA